MKASLWIIIIAIVVLLAGGIYFLAMSNYNTPSNPSANNQANPNSGEPRTHAIDIGDFAFNPSTLSIKKGDTVVWTNKDSASHTITSDSGSELSSGTLLNSQTYSHTFNTAGTFDYYCTLHSTMKANIIVE